MVYGLSGLGFRALVAGICDGFPKARGPRFKCHARNKEYSVLGSICGPTLVMATAKIWSGFRI